MMRTVQAEVNSRQNHLLALKKRHQDLSDKLEHARVHASVSDFYISELKKQKLHLKDLIEEFAESDTDAMARA